MRSLKDQNSRLEKQMVELKQAGDKASAERLRLKEENSKLRAVMEERERNKGFVEGQLRSLDVPNSFGAVRLILSIGHL